MKKSAFAFLFVISAFSAVAEHVTTCSNVFGAMPICSEAKKTIVAVPWVEAGGGDISVSNVLLTSNLTVGDKVHVLQSANRYNTWVLMSGEKGPYWGSVQQVSDAGVSMTPASDAQSIKRGMAFVLERKVVRKDGGNLVPFYLYGQVATGSLGDTLSCAITKGQNASPAWNLIAAPSTTAQAINAQGRWSGTIDPNDRILIPNADGTFQTELKYVNGAWKYYGFGSSAGLPAGAVPAKTWMEFTGSVPVGTGFWYVSRGGDPTIHWQDVPAVASN